MRYFDHDVNAADDDGIMALRIECGGAAVDAYWTLLEKIYRDESHLNLSGTDVGSDSVSVLVSHRLCIDVETLKKYVSSMLKFGLFSGTFDDLYSVRADRNIALYRKKAETARQNGKNGGRKPKSKTNAKPTGNRRRNQSATDVGVNKRKSIGFDKQNQYQYDGVDGADETAPPSSERTCPECGGKMEPTNASKPNGGRIWRCPSCWHEEVPE